MRRPSRTHLATAVATAIGLGLVALLALGPSPAGAQRSRPPRTITVAATGTAAGVPDTATISLGVDSQAASAAEALSRNSEKTKGVIDAMLFVGVVKRDIQTSNISLFPTFDQKGHITGYSVSTRMTAKTHDITKAGTVIDAAAKLAGDDIRVDSISLSIEDTGPVVRNARRRAVAAAHEHAGQLAHAARVRLGSARTIIEESNNAPVFEQSSRQRASSGSASIPVEAGTQELEIRVKVVYEIA